MINAIRHFKHHIPFTLMIPTPDCKMLHYLIVCERNKQENSQQLKVYFLFYFELIEVK